MKITNLRQFNAALKKAGVPAELVKGPGYFYFVGAELPSIYTNAFNHCPPSVWQAELDAVIAEYNKSQNYL